MSINNTTLLGLAQPVTGQESGVWGDDVNNGLTELVEIAIAGVNNITQDSDITLAVSNGSNSSSFTSTATNSTVAQYYVLNCSGSRTAARNIIVPTTSKTYVITNATTGGYAITIKKSGGTGVGIVSGETAIVFYNTISGDVAKISSNTITALVGILGTANGGTGLGGSTPFTANGVVYASSTSALATGSALTFDGVSKVTITGASSNGELRLIRTSTYPGDFSWSAGGLSSTTNIQLADNTNSQTAYGYIGGASGYHVWYQAGSEQMRLTSTGLGIGTSSPQQKLEVVGNTFLRGSAAGVRIGDGGGYGYISVYDNTISTAKDLVLQTGGGNLGLGVTPQTWTVYDRAMQIGSSASIYTSGVAETNLGTNQYYNSGFKYLGTGFAARYCQVDGTHRWYYAASGTAGGAITFTESARIDSSGNLLVGTTSTTNGALINWYKASGTIETSLGGTTSAQNHIVFANPNGNVGSIQVSGSATAYNTSSDQRLKTNIVDAPSGNIDDIKVRSFDWIVDGSHQDYGMIAQELYDVAPYAVTGTPDSEEMMGVDYSKLVPMMIKEIQQLKAEVATLKGA